MFVISWQGGTMGVVTLGEQTEFTGVHLVSAERKGERRDVQYASSSLLWRATRSTESYASALTALPSASMTATIPNELLAYMIIALPSEVTN
jgi:hypothetical protein